MRVHSVEVVSTGGTGSITAVIEWEDRPLPPFTLWFRFEQLPSPQLDVPGNCLIAAAFPLAHHHGERRIRIEAPVCPMLADGLLTIHSWWDSWAGVRTPAPLIEAAEAAGTQTAGRLRSAGMLSGGVDSFHMVHRNRRIYGKASALRLEQVILVHGFDFGRRQRDPQNALFEDARRRLQSVVERIGIGLGVCRTNIRHVPTTPGFWLHRQYGVAAAAVGHAAVSGPGCLFLAGTNDVANLSPLGSHPATDPELSSGQLRIVHDGVRFSRLEKVRDLMSWGDAIDNLRVCSVPGRKTLNCGVCSKCLRTRLELLAAGCHESKAFGVTAFDPELLAHIEIGSPYEVACYAEILSARPARISTGMASGITSLLHRYTTRAADPGALFNATRGRPDDAGRALLES